MISVLLKIVQELLKIRRQYHIISWTCYSMKTTLFSTTMKINEKDFELLFKTRQELILQFEYYNNRKSEWTVSVEDFNSYNQKLKQVIKEMRKALSTTQSKIIDLKKQNEMISHRRQKVYGCLKKKQQANAKIKEQVRLQTESIRMLI